MCWGRRMQDAGVTRLLIKTIKCQVDLVERVVAGSNGQQTKHATLSLLQYYHRVPK